jgi:hypothetical protein
MAKQTTLPTHSHSSPLRKPPITPASKSFELKARTPRNKLYTYKQCLTNDQQARRNAISAFKNTDTYIYEMCHVKRETMLRDIAAEVDAKRIDSGEHVSCLFEEEEMQEPRLSYEEAAEKWEVLRAEVASKTSGLRGKAQPKVRMLPKKMDVLEKKKMLQDVVEVEEKYWSEEDEVPEMVTSKGIPVVMIDDD